MGMPDDYAEIVLTCEGDFYDPSFHIQLDEFRHQFEQLISSDSEKVVVKKVEPWNSVRVTLNIPRHAVMKLQELARCQDGLLRSLGILSVQIEGDQAILLTVAGGKNQDAAPLVFRVPYDASGGQQSSSTSEEFNAAALQEFAQLLSQQGNMSAEDFLKFAAADGVGLPAATSSGSGSKKKHSSSTAYAPSALQSTNAHQGSLFHMPAGAQRAATALGKEPAALSSNSPMLVNLLQNGALRSAWAMGGFGEAGASTGTQLSPFLAKPKKRPPRRKRKIEQLNDVAALSDGGSVLAENANLWSTSSNGFGDSSLVSSGEPTVSGDQLNDESKLRTDATNMDISTVQTIESSLEPAISSVDGSVLESIQSAGITAPTASVANPGLGGANSVTGAGGINSLQPSVGASAVPVFPPGLMMMPVGNAMGSHNFLNAISLLPATQFLNLAALTTPVPLSADGQQLFNSTATVTTPVPPQVSALPPTDSVPSVVQVPDVPLLAASPFSLLSQMMNQHIPALLVSQVPNSQTGTTNTSIIPVSVALGGTSSLSLPAPSAPVVCQTSVSAVVSSPLLLNPTAAAMATLFGMASLFGNPSPLPLSFNAPFVPPRMSAPLPVQTDTTTMASICSSLDGRAATTMTDSSSQASDALPSSSLMSTISLDDVVDTLASVAALDGEEFTKPESEAVAEVSVSKSTSTEGCVSPACTVPDVAQSVDQPVSACLSSSLMTNNGLLVVTKAELNVPSDATASLVLSTTPVNGVVSGRNYVLSSASKTQLTVDANCTGSHSSVSPSSDRWLSPVLRSVLDPGSKQATLSSSSAQTPNLSLPLTSEMLYAHMSTATGVSVTTSAVVSAQANVTWTTAPVMAVGTSDSGYSSDAAKSSLSPKLTMPCASLLRLSPVQRISTTKTNGLAVSESHLDVNVKSSDGDTVAVLPRSPATLKQQLSPGILSGMERRSPGCVPNANLDGDDKMQIVATASSARQTDNVEAVNSMMAPGFPLNLTESVQRAMQGIPAESITPPPSPKPSSRSVAPSPNTRSKRTSPHLASQLARRTAGQVPLVSTLGEIRSVIDSATVVLPRVRLHGNTSVIVSKTAIIGSTTGYSNSSSVLSSAGNLSASSVTNCKPSFSATSLATPATLGGNNTRVSSVKVIGSETVSVSPHKSLSSGSCLIGAVSVAADSTGASSSSFLCATVSAMDHSYPAPAFGDVASFDTAANIVANNGHVNNSKAHKVEGITVNCEIDSVAIDVFTSDLQEGSMSSETNHADLHLLNQSDPAAEHKNAEPSEMCLRSRSKRSPLKHGSEEDIEHASLPANGALTAKRLRVPAIDEDQEDALRRDVKRIRRKTENSTGDAAEDDSNSELHHDVVGTASFPDTNHHTIAGAAGDVRSSLSPTLRRSTRSCKAKQFFEAAVLMSTKRGRSHQTEPS